MQRFQPSLLAFVLLLSGLSACVVRVRDGEWEHSSWSEWQEESEACASCAQHTKQAGSSAGTSKESSKDGDAAAKLELARLELEKARLASNAAVLAAEGALASKRAALEQAELALARHVAFERENRLAEAVLEVDEKQEDVDVKRLELEQMISTFANYGDEDYAKLNAELVVGRTRKALEFEERKLAIEQKELELLRDHELPAKARELGLELEEARREVDGAERELEEQRLAARIEVLEAEQELAGAGKKEKAPDEESAEEEDEEEDDDDAEEEGAEEEE